MVTASDENPSTSPLEAEPLARAYYPAGGRADYLVYPRDLEELRAVLHLAREHAIPLFILGTAAICCSG